MKKRSLEVVKPVERMRVFELVREAGIDVGDWKNYAHPEHPAKNPKYCYNWAFEGDNRVVLCLWYEEMRQDERGVFQRQNYRMTAEATEGLDATQRRRADAVDRAIRRAMKERLPIRVIVVSGSRRGENDGTASRVERRLLDPVTWYVAEYGDDGSCRLQRGDPEAATEARTIGAKPRTRLLTRITYNTKNWRRPSGIKGKAESAGSYSTENGFGHEEWLFRSEWLIDGWRYAFIEGFNRGGHAYHGRPLDVTLFTRQPGKRHRLVATIYDLECLRDHEGKLANDALAVFRANGWIKTMKDEIRAVGGNVGAFGDPKWAHHVINVRYRLENLDPYAPDTFLPNTKWFRDRHRYSLYVFDAAERNRLEQSFRGRQGSPQLPEPRQLFRRGNKPIQCDPQHEKMQAHLMAELQKEYGADHVWRERDFVDVHVETHEELILFEIKSDLDPRTVMRQAVGQILEYAYHPARPGRRPDRLVIVGRVPLGRDDQAYLKYLCEKFNLPLSYRVVKI